MLNDVQIEHLYRFCKQHYIHYYEVQAELVDHLANAIEERMSKDPGLSFERALAQAYDAFGGYKGMQAVQSQKEKAVRRQNWKLKKSLFLDYFRLPRLVLTATIWLLWFTGLRYAPATWIQVTVPAFIVGYWVLELVRTYPLHQRMNRVKTPLLLFQHREAFGLFAFYLMGMNMLVRVMGDFVTSPWGELEFNEWWLSSLLTFFIIVQLSFRAYLSALIRKGEELFPRLVRQAA